MTPVSERTVRNRVTKSTPDDGNISRKITACAACRKQKIKCDMGSSRPPCTRCRKRGLTCVINRSLQTILEDDKDFKSTVAEKISRIEAALSKVGEKVGLVDVLSEEPAHDAVSDLERTKPSWDVTLEGGPAVAPGSILVEQNAASMPSPPPSTRSRSGLAPDLISKHILSKERALSLFNIYHDRLDHFVYRILAEHSSLESLRSSSALLTAAVCTVGALHETAFDEDVYHSCYREFVSLCAAQTFSRRNSLDDIRGLCIGAFWLFEISWILIGIGVRIATEMNLHLSIKPALHGDRTGYLQTRLYFLVYICDHHFSIAYGRPPMSWNCDSVNTTDQFLSTEHATEDDARLVSQVKIWSIATRVFNTFGAQVDTSLSQDMVPQLRRLSIELDTWRADWNERFSPNPRIANYPAKGVGMHYHFAKLYLHSHAFRGIDSAHSGVGFSSSVSEIAENAVLSAKSILRVITSDPEMQSHLHGLPVYFDTMIAFSVVFLIKVAVKYTSVISIEASEIFTLVEQVVSGLEIVTANMHERHLLSYIAPAIRKLLDKSRRPDLNGVAPEANLQSPFYLPSMESMWTPTGSTILQNYDLLSSQNILSGFDSWNFNFDLGPPAMN